MTKNVTVNMSHTSDNGAVIAAACADVINNGGGNVYIPVGDWQCDEKDLVSYFTSGAAIHVDLTNLPLDAWLNIIGDATPINVTTPNGQILRGAPSTILRDTIPNYGDGVHESNVGKAMFFLGTPMVTSNRNGINGTRRHVRVSGLTILGNVAADGSFSVYDALSGITIFNCDDFLIDHCWIDSHQDADISVAASRGVISKCVLSDLYHVVMGGIMGYGVGVGGNLPYNASSAYGDVIWLHDPKQVYGKYYWQGSSVDWDTPVFNNDGTVTLVPQTPTTNIPYVAGPVYVEDCTFYWTRHTVSSSEYSYYVARYNKAYGGVGLQMFDMHGGGNSLAGQGFASRAGELYNNQCFGTDSGSNTIAGTYGLGTYGHMQRGGASLIFNNTFTNILDGVELGNENYSASYPTYPEYINDTYIWNNIYNNINSPLVILNGEGVAQNINYWANSPTFPYTPFTYPHPLTLLEPTFRLNINTNIPVGFNIIQLA